MKIKYILVLCLYLFEVDSFGHDQIVHQAITKYAEASAYADSSAYADFLDTISADFPRLAQPPQRAAVQSMVNGSYDEDFTSAEDSVGGNRSYNHFYDPLDTTYGKGLSDIPPDIRGIVGTNSFAWASILNGPGINFRSHFFGIGDNVNTMNIYSWQNARVSELLGLTATDQLGRQTNLDNMFRAIGQVMHLLEDTSQPQHVRNEQHVFPSTNWWVHTFDPWVSPIEDYGSAHWQTLNYGDGSMLNWTNIGFTKLEDFWDRHLYAPGSATVLQNAETGGAQLGLAEWCNGNFLGARHLYPEFFKPGDIAYYPFPSRNHSTDYNIVKANPPSGLHSLTLANGHLGHGIYLHKTTDGVDIQYLSRVNYLGVKIPGLSGVPYCTITDDNVLSNYHNIFIPKAVKYSAGLLDYFFRGQLGMSIQGGANTNTVIFTMTNLCSQSFSNGTFTLMKDDGSGTRTVATNYAVTTTIPSGGTYPVSYTDSTITTNTIFYMVYQGSIGSSDPVDNGIAIAVSKFQQPPPASCPFTETIWETPLYDTSLGAITSSAYQNTINVSGNYSSAGPTNLTSMYAAGSFFYMGPAFTAYVHLDPTSYALVNQGQIEIEVKVFVDGNQISVDTLPDGAFGVNNYNGFSINVPQSTGVTIRTEVTCIYGDIGGGVSQSGLMDFGVTLECGTPPSPPIYASAAQSATAHYRCACLEILGYGDYTNYVGDPQTYSFTVPAGSAGGSTQAEADSIAQAMACADAQEAAILYGSRLGCQTTIHPNGGPTGAIGFDSPPCY